MSLQYKLSANHTIGTYAADRINIFSKGILGNYRARDRNAVITRRHSGMGDGSTASIVHTDRTKGEFLTQLPLTNETKDSLKLAPSDVKRCVDLTNDSYEVDIESLLEIAGSIPGQNTTCPDGQIYVDSQFLPESIMKGRKIPKIIHMTSKSKCFTKAYADNVERWRFDGHSFFLHDDADVNKLYMSREWKEFPLLDEVRSCINCGAGMADLWRYVALWEYGGIYTDMDNGPGHQFLNGTLIHNDIDSLFEVERGGYPSQYFFAGAFRSVYSLASWCRRSVSISRYFYSLSISMCTSICLRSITSSSNSLLYGSGCHSASNRCCEHSTSKCSVCNWTRGSQICNGKCCEAFSVH